MAANDEKVERVVEADHPAQRVDGSSKEDGIEKAETTQADLADTPAVKDGPRGMQPPEFLRNMSMEDRLVLEAKLKKKIDIRLMPMIIIMYILNYIDRNNIAAARLAGLERDLNLSSIEFQTSVSILFVGYLLMQIPSNLYLNKTGKPAIYLPTCMIIWGVISAATAACTTAGGLYAVRFFLGFVEAAYFPGCLYYLSCWYTRAELGFRTAVLYSGALISGAFSGLIAAGIRGNMDGTRGYSAWQWLFIIEGVVTIAIAFAAYWILPNFPRTTTWLTEEERQLAAWRLEEDIGEDDWVDSAHQTFWGGAKEAFKDVKTWVLLVLVMCIVSSGTVTNFFPSVVATLNPDHPFTEVQTLLLTCPPYVLAVITTYFTAWSADRTGERYLHITIPLWVALVAYIMAATTISTGPRYTAMMLMPTAVYSAFVVALAWISNTLPRPPAKRAAALAFINAVSNTSSIYASYLYPKDHAPRYTLAFIVNCVTCFIGIVAATVLRFMLVKLNKKLAAGIYVEGAINSKNALPGEAAQHGFRFKV